MQQNHLSATYPDYRRWNAFYPGLDQVIFFGQVLLCVPNMYINVLHLNINLSINANTVIQNITDGSAIQHAVLKQCLHLYWWINIYI